jgi:hypothetical protein
MVGQIILFLLFMGAEKLVNRKAGYPRMNGAGWYLVTAAILFGAILISQASSVPDSGSAERNAELMGQLIGGLVGAFMLPVGAAIYYSNKFARARAAAQASALELGRR